MPTYAVYREGRKPRVIEAPNPAAARQHVATDELSVRKIEVSEAFALANDGVRLEKAGEVLPEFAEVDDGREVEGYKPE